MPKDDKLIITVKLRDVDIFKQVASVLHDIMHDENIVFGPGVWLSYEQRIKAIYTELDEEGDKKDVEYDENNSKRNG